MKTTFNFDIDIDVRIADAQTGPDGDLRRIIGGGDRWGDRRGDGWER
jgi:hypothetical protein